MDDPKSPPREHRRGQRTIRVVAEADDCPICWICLDGPGPERPLVHPCRCPSWAHASCIARWQLQSAGTRRETHCDFCRERLPDWKGVLTPDATGAAPPAPAVMNVNFDGKTYSFTVAPGADGYRAFTAAIRRAFRLPGDSELNITFTCDEPSSGSLLTLSGPGAYDAAVHCAAVSAARRGSSSSGNSSAGGCGGGCGSPAGSSGCGSPSGGAEHAGGGSGTSSPSSGGSGSSSGRGSGSGSSGDEAHSPEPACLAPPPHLLPPPPRVRAPRSSSGSSGRDAPSSSGPSPRSAAAADAPAAAAGRREGGGGGFGRKLRAALSDMLVIR